MTALDAGGGTGAVARVMSELVGPTGRVVVLDRSVDRLEEGRRLAAQDGLTNISFLCGELEHLPSELEGAFDYVWCRFVFEYLQQPDRVFDNLVCAARIGGRVVVGDLDGNGLQHYPMTPELEQGLAKLMHALADRFDPFAGRKLFTWARRAGLADIRVHLLPYHVYAGAVPSPALPNWRQKLEVIRPAAQAAFGGEPEYQRFVQAFMGQLADPDSFTYSTLILVAGNKLR